MRAFLLINVSDPLLRACLSADREQALRPEASGAKD